MNWKFWKKTTWNEREVRLMDRQLKLLEELDFKLTSESPPIPGVPHFIEAVAVPQHLHGLSPEKLIETLDIKQRPYMPRSLVLFTQPHGDWLLLIGWRDPEQTSTDLERAMFNRLLVQTNACRV